jgi:hypothetical protein
MACIKGGLHARFEEYVSRVIFRIPLPERQFAKKMRIILPAIQGPFVNEIFEDERMNFKEKPCSIEVNFPSYN